VSKPLLESVLVANRGEIALRVIRACRELEIRSVAVFSEADRLSPHVLEADEAFLLGPASATESYLNSGRILAIARKASVRAIHPGYGFLSENASFAQAVIDDGLIFVGPAPETIEAMGNKIEARKRMKDAGLSIVPGLLHPTRDAEAALASASELGYPVLLKAAAGGGGKGMRVVSSPAELPRAFEAARREAAAAFGDGAIYLERFLKSPRHIEVQILGDSFGSVVQLGERECSIQRRHQKLIEEAPSPALSDAQRAEMGAAAVRAACAVGYQGAGTIEFLWEGGEFHFLEMNTRIQVEHPVTELVTGIDLVEWQIKIASGQAIPFSQDDIVIRGHAIECRITAENVASGFLPATGTIRRLNLPSGAGVRWDGGIREGQEIGPYYDSLLGKLIVHASDRDAAINRMSRALTELSIEGVETTACFHQRLMRDPDFRTGIFDTHYVEQHPDLTSTRLPDDEARALAVLAAVLEHRESTGGGSKRNDLLAPRGQAFNSWQRAGWRWAR